MGAIIQSEESRRNLMLASPVVESHRNSNSRQNFDSHQKVIGILIVAEKVIRILTVAKKFDSFKSPVNLAK